MRLETLNIIAEKVSDKIIYVKNDNSFYFFNGTHHERDHGGRCLEKLEEVIQENFYEIASIEGMKNPKKTRWSSISQLKKILKELTIVPSIHRTVSDMISERDCIVLPDRILDLKTKDKLEPSSKRIVTNRTNVTYSNTDKYPIKIMKYLHFIMEHPGYQEYDLYSEENTETEKRVNFLLIVIGSLITGHKTELLPYIIGDGANGKSVLSTILSEIFGDYVGHMPANELLKSTTENGKYLDKVKYTRLIIGSEGGENLKATPERIKAITGGDPIQYRGLFKDYELIQPQCMPIIFSNHLFKCETDDYGLKRRLCVFKLYRIVDPKDRVADFAASLRDEYPGFLKLILEHASKWISAGKKYDLPESVIADTERAWKKIIGFDFERGFIKKHIVKLEISRATRGREPSYNFREIYERYKHYCDLNEHHPCSEISLGKILQAEGFTRPYYKYDVRGVSIYKNIEML